MKKSFTLLELLIVILIIGTLAVIAIPQYQKTVKRAKESVAQANLRELYKGVMVYQSTTGAYPGKLKTDPTSTQEVDFRVDIDNADHINGYDLRIAFDDTNYDYKITNATPPALQAIRTLNTSDLRCFEMKTDTGDLSSITCP